MADGAEWPSGAYDLEELAYTVWGIERDSPAYLAALNTLGPAYLRRKRYEAKLLAIELAPFFGATTTTAAPAPEPTRRAPTPRQGPDPSAVGSSGVTTTGKPYTVVSMDSLMEGMSRRTA